VFSWNANLHMGEWVSAILAVDDLSIDECSTVDGDATVQCTHLMHELHLQGGTEHVVRMHVDEREDREAQQQRDREQLDCR